MMGHVSEPSPVAVPTPTVAGLLRLTRDLLARPAGPEAYEAILDHALAAVAGAEAGSVVMCGDDGRFHYVAVRGFDVEALRSVTFDRSDILTDVSVDGRAVVIRDVRARNGAVLPAPLHERLRAVGEVDRIRATIAAPIVLDGEVVATFRLDTFGDPARFDEGACRVAEAYALVVGWVLRRWRAEEAAARESEAYRRLYAEAERRAREYQVLDRLRQAVARGSELGEVLRLTAEAVAEALEVRMVGVYLVEAGELRLHHTLGYVRVYERIGLGQGITGRVAVTGEPVLVNDVADHPDYLSTGDPVVSELAVPLMAEGEVLGVLNAESADRAFGADDLRLLLAIRDQVGVAVQRARLWASVRASEARFRLLAENARDLIGLHDRAGKLTYASPAARELLGLDPQALLGRSLVDLAEPAERDALDGVLRDALEGGAAGPAVAYRVRTHEGGERWLETGVRAVIDEAGGVEALVSTTRDVSERRSFEERLRRAALVDGLTGLPNRALLHDRLAQAIERRRRYRDARYAVLFLDLDGFKSVNDALGHAVGDALLQAVAARLRDSVRAADTVARIGGDEFCVLLPDQETDDEAERTAARLQAALAQPFQVAGRDLYTSASIGIARGRAGYTEPGEVLRDADTAMYRAKAAGVGRIAVFDAAMRVDAVARLELETELRRAVAAGDIEVAYQPIVRLADGEVVGFEALARWRHPTLGPIDPSVFVPLAEGAGLIAAIDRWVIDRACRAMAAWRGPERDWTLSVNVSAQHFTIGDVAAETEAALEASGLDPAALRLEITERALMAHPDLARAALTRLRALGTRVQVDDFGTGYSSLIELQRLSVDALKLDRSFVSGMGADGMPVVAAVTQLARHMGIDVVAEGVERTDQVGSLTELGCRYGQGFLFAPALAEDEVVAWAATRATVPSVGGDGDGA